MILSVTMTVECLRKCWFGFVVPFLWFIFAMSKIKQKIIVYTSGLVFHFLYCSLALFIKDANNQKDEDRQLSHDLFRALKIYAENCSNFFSSIFHFHFYGKIRKLLTTNGAITQW